MSYRLETPRSRLPPLQVDKPEPLLYNLPAARSVSPPTSPRSPSRARLISPTSPTFSRSRTPINGRSASSPGAGGGRNRSATPSGVTNSELDAFAEYCRAWYFDQDDNSGRLMTQTLANLPSSHRAPYSRLQASIRSAYHRSVNARRTAEFRAQLSATQPGGSLLPHARAHPRGNAARKERYERFERFVRNWCTMGMPGPQPFFQALWAIMRLQIVPEGIGGAGQSRIEWEFDDAVLRETGGKDFMMEAIDVLKGVLAFTETPSSKRASSASTFEAPPTIHSRSKSQPLSSQPVATQPKRARAPSDPFLDTPALSSISSSPASASSTMLVTPTTEEAASPNAARYATEDTSYDDTDEEFLRIWTSPDLPNPEYIDLLSVFPTFITRRVMPRFPVAAAPKDLEEGAEEGRSLNFGTGTIRVSSLQRSDDWEGGWWTRFCFWWKQVFC